MPLMKLAPLGVVEALWIPVNLIVPPCCCWIFSCSKVDMQNQICGWPCSLRPFDITWPRHLTITSFPGWWYTLELYKNKSWPWSNNRTLTTTGTEIHSKSEQHAALGKKHGQSWINLSVSKLNSNSLRCFWFRVPMECVFSWPPQTL